MDFAQVQTFLADDWFSVQDLFKGALYSDATLMNETNTYLVSNEGKMLRPMLSLLVSKACGNVTDESKRVAAASELLHNATLLHDDVLDQSSRRRGVPTVMSMLGSKASVLAGDFWLVMAVDTILGCRRHTKTLLGMFSHTVKDLVDGEMFQMEKAESADTTRMDYEDMIYLKTATLFETICCAAAITAGAPRRVGNAVREYGRNLGMAFQIKDDILDYDGADLGKPVGTDLREGKITLPLLEALDGVEPKRQAEVRRMVKEIPEKEGNVAKVADFVKARNGTALAAVTLQGYVNRAKDALEPLDWSPAKDWLLKMADYCAYRTI